MNIIDNTARRGTLFVCTPEVNIVGGGIPRKMALTFIGGMAIYSV